MKRNRGLDMIIANSSPLAALTGADMPSEGVLVDQAASQINAQSISAETRDQAVSDDDFWLMLNQQLTGFSIGEELQVVENEGLPGMEGFAEVDDGSELPTALMNDMKLYSAEPELAEIDVLTESTETLAVAVPLPVNAQSNLTTNGDELPLPRQTVSVDVLLPVTPIATTATKDHLKLTDVESDSQLFPAKMSETGVSEDADMLVGDKAQPKQPVFEQMTSVIKDNSAVMVTQLNNFSATAPQNQTNPPLPSSLQTLQMSPQATVSQWGEALGEKVSLLLNKQLNSAEIRLDPPHLGKLDIQIQIKDDSASILINTQHAQTRELIESASVRLKEFLQEAGYTSVDVDVSHKEQSMAEGDLSEQEGDGSNENNDQQSLIAQNELAELHHREISFNVDNGRIDYFA